MLFEIRTNSVELGPNVVDSGRNGQCWSKLLRIKAHLGRVPPNSAGFGSTLGQTSACLVRNQASCTGLVPERRLIDVGKPLRVGARGLARCRGDELPPTWCSLAAYMPAAEFSPHCARVWPSWGSALQVVPSLASRQDGSANSQSAGRKQSKIGGFRTRLLESGPKVSEVRPRERSKSGQR